MGVYDKVSKNSDKRVNAEKMDRLGSFYARLDSTKYVSSPAKGNFAIVECTVIEAHDDGYKNGEFLCHMRSQDEYGFMNRFMTEYCAAMLGVSFGHKFSDNEDDNDDIWDGHKQDVFGKPDMVDGKPVFKNENILKGVVAHYKIVEDNQAGRKTKKLDSVTGDVIIYKKVKLIGFIGPNDLDPAILAKELPNLHSSYHG